MSKNTPKSAKSRKLKKLGPQPIKSHKTTAKITLCFKQAKIYPDPKTEKASRKFIDRHPYIIYAER